MALGSSADPTQSINTPYSNLTDVQGTQDKRGVALRHAGVRNVEMPLKILQKDGQTQQVTANVSMSAGLTSAQKGTHMSRFVIQLNEWSQKRVLSLHLREFLNELKDRLETEQVSIDIRFQYFIQKAAPVSGISAPMAYDCELKGRLDQGQLTVALQVKAAFANLCPCSKAISDYGAHNQRSYATMDVITRAEDEQAPIVWIEDLIQIADDAASCPVFPLLKRADEKWVTERQYNNPKFVEDIARDLTLSLRQHEGIKGFSLQVEALESIHGHNAWAANEENYQPLD